MNSRNGKLKQSDEGGVMKRKPRFTLTETLVAVFLSLLATLFIFSSFSGMRRGILLSGNYSSSTMLATSLLNDARRSGFDNVAPRTGNKSISSINNGETFEQKLDYHLDVQEVDRDKKLVWATVTWNESGKERKVALETLMVRY